MRDLPSLPQILRFLSAGALGVLLYYVTLLALTEVFGVWYVTSAIVASLLNFTSNFVLQKVWTFENKRIQGTARQVRDYVVLVIVLFALNVALLYVLVEYLYLWYLVAQVIVTIVLTIISFFVSRRIFRN